MEKKISKRTYLNQDNDFDDEKIETFAFKTSSQHATTSRNSIGYSRRDFRT